MMLTIDKDVLVVLLVCATVIALIWWAVSSQKGTGA